MNSLSPTLFQSLWQEADSFQDISEVQEDGKAAHGMGEENTERLEALGQCTEQQQQQNVPMRVFMMMWTHFAQVKRKRIGQVIWWDLLVVEVYKGILIHSCRSSQHTGYI